MKGVLAFLLDFVRITLRSTKNGYHDDTLRANQGDTSRPAFSFWRALVS
jgi:hypothetical protein